MSVLITESLQSWQTGTLSKIAASSNQIHRLPIMALEMCGCFKQQKINHRYFNSTEKTEKQLLSKLKNSEVSKLVITANDCNWQAIAHFLKTLRAKKQWNKLTVIICSHQENIPAKLLIEVGADFICPKYAVVSVTKLIQALDTPMNPFLDKVPGIIFKNMLGKYCVQQDVDSELYKDLGVWTDFSQKGLKSLMPKHILVYWLTFNQTNVLKPLDILQAEIDQLNKTLPNSATIAFLEKDLQSFSQIKNLPKNAEMLCTHINNLENNTVKNSLFIDFKAFYNHTINKHKLQNAIHRIYLSYHKKPSKKMQKKMALQLIDWPKSKIYICRSAIIEKALPLSETRLSTMLNYRKYVKHLRSGSYNFLKEISYFLRSI